MRLLLDEMYPASIAVGLRRRGHDVLAVQEETDLRQLTDADLLAAAANFGRAVVTENVRDFVPLVTALVAGGRTHPGLILTTNRSWPRHRAQYVGAMTKALDRFLVAHPGDSPASGIFWL